MVNITQYIKQYKISSIFIYSLQMKILLNLKALQIFLKNFIFDVAF